MTGLRDRRRVWRRDHGAMLSGVCIGLAEDLDLPLPMVRIVTLLFLVLPTGLAYLALSMLLRRGPIAARQAAEAPRRTSHDNALLRHRLQALEPRLKRIEAFVTSSAFELDRGFRQMGE
ncbi:PspC domain-containing protein [Lichenicoccus sp.]|uniref:PspC domain-containing protein n=1 Tax=Lichenicoccus sp. TaxID=2781899 RepID=UPI003D125FBE